jgi:hypothetical protein
MGGQGKLRHDWFAAFQCETRSRSVAYSGRVSLELCTTRYSLVNGKWLGREASEVCLHVVRAGCDQSRQQSQNGESLHSTGLSEILSFLNLVMLSVTTVGRSLDYGTVLHALRLTVTSTCSHTDPWPSGSALQAPSPFAQTRYLRSAS